MGPRSNSNLLSVEWNQGMRLGPVHGMHMPLRGCQQRAQFDLICAYLICASRLPECADNTGRSRR